MINILVVGNSFSENGTFYLHQVAQSMGIEINVVNLNLGGCSFERHWYNIQHDEKLYRYEKNGFYDEESQKNPVAITDVLGECSWDLVISQQASRDSGRIETYEPYASLVYGYLQEKIPKAKLGIQETWAYEIDSQHEGFLNYNRDQLEMYSKIQDCDRKVAAKLGLFVIPTGDAIQLLRLKKPFDYASGGMSLCVDGHHLSPHYGKYAAALTWLKVVANADVGQVKYIPQNRYALDFKVDETVLSLIKETVQNMAAFS